MIRCMATKVAQKMAEYNVIEKKVIRVYAYGLELLFSSLAGIVVLIAVSVIWGKPFLWIPYLIGFVPLRLTGGGYHFRLHPHAHPATYCFVYNAIEPILNWNFT